MLGAGKRGRMYGRKDPALSTSLGHLVEVCISIALTCGWSAVVHSPRARSERVPNEADLHELHLFTKVLKPYNAPFSPTISSPVRELDKHSCAGNVQNEPHNLARRANPRAICILLSRIVASGCCGCYQSLPSIDQSSAGSIAVCLSVFLFVLFFPAGLNRIRTRGSPRGLACPHAGLAPWIPPAPHAAPRPPMHPAAPPPHPPP